jgi:hypothetical protein
MDWATLYEIKNRRKTEMGKNKKSDVYVLRTSNVDLTSYGGFQWPKRGRVSAPDWDPKPVCGGGLHGALWGEGDGSLFDWSEDAVWQVVKVYGEVIDLGGKVKFQSGYVVYSGDRQTATELIKSKGSKGPVIGSIATAGDGGTATAGDGGTATAGYQGTATAGDWGTATAGYQGTATAGEDGEIRIRFSDGSRYRLAVGYVGEDGILANVPYKVDAGTLVRAD